MTEVFGPGWGNYAIRGIIETSLPEPVSLVPETPGWWLLLGLIVGSVAWGAWVRWQRFLRNAYRREAQAALASVEARVKGGDKDCLRELAPLLRATALAAVDSSNRDSIAALRGKDWEEMLHQLAPRLAPLPVATLNALAYGPLSHTPDKIDGLFEQLREWITVHERANESANKGAHD
ncbi:DUF4381 domain-containing protein [Congregibacter litoralis]|uniref:DUF4381 domain-containing protein n=1 Tax=Congregibacter litoralis KT71 TaxID=314285 RepID=A4ADR7_9GAMM|nr:DUF4381 domain-containing protein [Congregibacter litoralis]EAQ95875.1 Domain protein of unknown function [Congregibacter litoralis KT71]